MVHLDAASLPRLDARVSVPGYDRSRVRPGIVHIGVGAFHRAHQAMYLDRLLELGGDPGWGVCGVGVMPRDAAVRDVLRDQDHLYTLLTRAPDGTERARVVGSVVAHHHVPDDPEAALARMADPATRIVSLTITEGGYSVDDATGEFDPRDEQTLADLADPARPPGSALGLLAGALRRRRDAGTVPFAVVSCDNMPGNGTVCRRALLSFTARTDPGLSAWIEEHVAFPSSMVDRITPATTDALRSQLATRYGVEDGWPVVAEDFAQWVLEDRFPAGRPALERVGVQLVQDVEPYELMKLRLLNASHQAMSHLGVLAGRRWVHEVGRDRAFSRFLRDYMDLDARPTLPEVPGVDLDAYCEELLARFGNEAVCDTLARLATDSSDRIPKFLLPVLRERRAAGADVRRMVLVLAAWSRFLEGRAEDGTPIEPSDLRLAELRSHLAREAEQPGAFLDCRPVFGALGQDEEVRAMYVAARRRLAERGALACVQELLR
ncbi:mannitol dehydrogenase family protein [Auraticoccus sp. F435]|uniref:Mannitol-1-phosphate 5-dehydrogenase n=1 Tax=Auraticoccus cholistanensis TaxID=2656650 RepID=A0A6A9V1N8_9ACTN|nr:mannitol dehydrogenase family protein [Auraticoccus cholistanensis]MVA77516.1 mannitol dehydrogenase family protein [Auraticoccus cholistanensis]